MGDSIGDEKKRKQIQDGFNMFSGGSADNAKPQASAAADEIGFGQAAVGGLMDLGKDIGQAAKDIFKKKDDEEK